MERDRISKRRISNEGRKPKIDDNLKFYRKFGGKKYMMDLDVNGNPMIYTKKENANDYAKYLRNIGYFARVVPYRATVTPQNKSRMHYTIFIKQKD